MKIQSLKDYLNLVNQEANLVMEIEILERNKNYIKSNQLKQQKEFVKHERLRMKGLLKLQA